MLDNEAGGSIYLSFCFPNRELPLGKKIDKYFRRNSHDWTKAAVVKLNGQIWPFGKLRLNKLNNVCKVTQILIRRLEICLQVFLYS